MATVHISENEAVLDLPGLLARVRAGEEIVIEKAASVSVVLRTVEPKGRLLSESIALAKAHAKELGYEPRMDPDFAADLEEIIRERRPRSTSGWD